MQLGDPNQEKNRLDALYRYGLLDTPAEAAFDCITRVVKGALDVPIALIVLVDKDRQWFKSRQGTKTSETTRDVSFCTRTIEGNQPLLIPNLKKDPVFAKNPLVSGFPFLRFYSGVPLRTADGFNIGSLCVLGYRPRALKASEVTILVDMARLTMDQIELRHIADVDYLTGLITRHVLLKTGNQEVERIRVNGGALSLIVFEVDKFSEISRKDGYNTSDSLLQNLVHKCQAILGEDASFARVGDGRFAVLMPNTGEAGAIDIARKIMALIGALEVPEFAGRYKLSSSAGIAVYLPEDKDFNHLFTRAEIALQKNKKNSQSILSGWLPSKEDEATVSYGSVDFTP